MNECKPLPSTTRGTRSGSSSSAKPTPPAAAPPAPPAAASSSIRSYADPPAILDGVQTNEVRETSGALFVGSSVQAATNAGPRGDHHQCGLGFIYRVYNGFMGS